MTNIYFESTTVPGTTLNIKTENKKKVSAFIELTIFRKCWPEGNIVKGSGKREVNDIVEGGFLLVLQEWEELPKGKRERKRNEQEGKIA